MLLKDIPATAEQQVCLDSLLKTDGTIREYFIKEFIKTKDKYNNVLYVHTPFCPQKCSYCHCLSKASFTKAEFDQFYNNVWNEHIEVYRKIFDVVSFDQVYFGGGTPTIANPATLRKIFDSIPNFKSISLKCIESSPHTLTDEHLRLFNEYNFDFISIGIQSLDKKICERHNRKFLGKNEFINMSKILHENGIYYNYDLICFLDKGDIRDLQGFENELNFVLTYGQPSCVTIHQYYQSTFTVERTEALINTLLRVLDNNKKYTCIVFGIMKTERSGT